MSRYSHTHPEKVGHDPRTHVAGYGSPANEGSDDYEKPEPPEAPAPEEK